MLHDHYQFSLATFNTKNCKLSLSSTFFIDFRASIDLKMKPIITLWTFTAELSFYTRLYCGRICFVLFCFLPCFFPHESVWNCMCWNQFPVLLVKCKSETFRLCVCVYVFVCMCVCVHVPPCVCVCVCVCARLSVCLRERERERGTDTRKRDRQTR